MKIGIFSANYLDLKIEDVLRKASDLGYEAVELPAFQGNSHLDIDEIVKGNNAKKYKKMIESYGLIISALSNHSESNLILGPYGVDTDGIYKGSKEEKIAYGKERVIKTAQAANALEVPVVCGFTGNENF